MTGLPSCEPTVCDRDRLEGLLVCLGVDNFWGDGAGTGGPDPRLLIGETEVELGFWIEVRGASKKFPGARELLDWCDMLDELLDVLRRPSPFGPATNETSNGEDG